MKTNLYQSSTIKLANPIAEVLSTVVDNGRGKYSAGKIKSTLIYLK